MLELLKGAPVAEAINQRTQELSEHLRSLGVSPTLALLRVGEREDDIAYEQSAMKRCEKAGVDTRSVILPADVSQKGLIAAIEELNCDKAVHGILLFMPLPKHLDGEATRRALSPEKDVDGISYGSLAGVFTGSGEGFPPCTAKACIEILDFYGIDCTGKNAVVVGRSLVVGRPLAMMLMEKNATVTICHTKTQNLPSVTKEAQLLIAAVGKAKAIGAEHLSTGQVLIDVGINFVDGKMCGDVDFPAAEAVSGFVTPVPGGVGSVTTAVLASHVTEAARRFADSP
ncbi:MAG: bifunctional 5,10-methylenetetrahydrofolate dehydrogenase/5,10-methenyltetrahydrofolate cyclohydrolase [Clostridiales bacterium]|nr:bifunctional 5,10-methylenetetrahydrofolate dehydrogenase/5,10-methenyltetrahydrofolate cyclohydrolase [Clostridiales bacterium]